MNMNWNEYERHVVGQLCWDCHVSTSPSHHVQRRCDGCRRKWRYQTRRIRWELLKAFALDATALRASQVVGCCYPVAHSVFTACRRTLTPIAESERMAVMEQLGLGTASGPSKPGRNASKVARTTVFAVIERKTKVHVIDCQDREELIRAVASARVPGILLGCPGQLKSLRDLVRQPVASPRVRGVHRRSRIGRVEAFWGNATDRILRQARGVTPGHLADYLAESEYRFNHSPAALIEELHSVLTPSVRMADESTN